MTRLNNVMLGLGSFRYIIYIWLVCLAYFMFYASERYVPEAQVYVKSGKSMTMEGLPNLALMSMGVSQASPDLLLLKSYMHSKDILVVLNEKLDLKEHYSSSSVDFLSRLKPWASDEDFLTYYRDHLTLDIDAQSGILFVQAEAFNSEYAVKLTNLLISEGEKYINKVGQDIALKEIEFVQKEVDRAAEKLQAVKNELLGFQNSNRTLSPEEEGIAYVRAISLMRGEVIKAKAELKTLSSFMNEDTAEIQSLRAKINAIEEQIQLEEERATASGSGSLGKQNALFQALKLKLEFATQIYSTTVTALEQTRVEASRKLKHVVTVQKSAAPDEALYPKVIYNLATLFVVMSLIFGIYKMVRATVKEHRNA